MEQLNKIIEGMREPLVDMVSRWLRIASVRAEGKPGAPFGDECREALDVALKDAADLGFDVRNFDGYAGDVRMGSIGVEPLGILGHLDVVPAGDGWKTDPFVPTRDGDRIYARGSSDDKGPVAAALLAMKAVKDAGIPLRREVRLILGCSEETAWDDMAYYSQHCDMPRTGFSPDASYPVINTEKGSLQISLHAPFDADGIVKEIHVGERHNVIPGEATALLSGDKALQDTINEKAAALGVDVKATLTAEGVKVLSVGITGHAAYPEGARNALGQMLVVLDAAGLTGVLSVLAKVVGTEYNGESLGIACSDKTSGPLSCNLGILQYDAENGLYATLDIRYPILCDHKALTAALTAAIGDTITVKVDSQTEPHHVAPNSELVTALLDAYHEVTGRERVCVATGGGTYAKCLEEGVAFGCAFPDDEDLAHQANEYLSIDGLMTSIRIFAAAIVKLAGA